MNALASANILKVLHGSTNINFMHITGVVCESKYTKSEFCFIIFQCTIFEVICIVCYAWFAISFILSFILLLEIFIIFF